MANITIVLPLKDRESETKIWLEHNIFEWFDYIIADGSTTDQNQTICRPYVAKNLRYVKYPPDQSYEDFLNKLSNATSLVHTDYMVTVDCDDFLLKQGLLEIDQAVENDPSISLIQGRVGMVMPAIGSTYKRIEDWKHTLCDKGDPLSNVKAGMSDYSPLWYAIVKVDLQKQALAILKQIKANSFLFYEYFHTLFLLSNAEKFNQQTHYYYVRLFNETSSENQSAYPKSRFDAVLNEDYSRAVREAIGHIGDRLGLIDTHDLYNRCREFHIERMLGDFDLRLRDKIVAALRYNFVRTWRTFRSKSRGVSLHELDKLFQ